MNDKKLYWICQVCGWSAMVSIETVNYTFFIVGKFNVAYFNSFLISALIGLISTHILRYILKRNNFFQRQRISIWIAAALLTLLLSITLTFANFLRPIIQNPGLINQLRPIDILGTIINWMRYVGVWIIIYFMYQVLQQNNNIKQEKMAMETLAKTTELELLKAQLNPHFLFNALNSIKALVTIDPEKSKEGIVKLSELLRFTLQYGKERLIPINDELMEVKKYLELEQLRFGERLKIIYDIEESTLNQTIPPAVILTLAENAVKHGVAKYASPSTITVSSRLVKDHVLFKVKNPGTYNPGNLSGIGLKHISKRLDEIYSNRYFFQITEKEGQVEANIQIPL
jgi:LytS/YehU family sensor histidine kinase